MCIKVMPRRVFKMITKQLSNKQRIKLLRILIEEAKELNYNKQLIMSYIEQRNALIYAVEQDKTDRERLKEVLLC